jgi:TonB family protein
MKLIRLCLLVAFTCSPTRAALFAEPGRPSQQQPNTPATPTNSADQAEANRLNAEVVRLYGEKKYDAALPLARRALELKERAMGREHEALSPLLMNLAMIHRAKGSYHEADGLLWRALKIDEKKLGKEHPNLYPLLLNYAWIRYAQGFTGDAENIFKRCVLIKEKQSGPEHPDVAEPLYYLASFYQKDGKPAKAVPVYERVIAIKEKRFGPSHLELVEPLEKCSCALRQSKKDAEAFKLEARAREITNLNNPRARAVSSGLLQGTATHREQPAYPRAALAERLAGVVLVKVVIDEVGNVLEAKLLCGPDLLAQASLEAARKWKFAPTKLEGVPVKVQGILTFNFSLQ